MKIRSRLVLWYFFTSLILLLVFSLGTYLGMRHLLFNTLDEELNEKIDEISEIIGNKTVLSQNDKHHAQALMKTLKDELKKEIKILRRERDHYRRIVKEKNLLE